MPPKWRGAATLDFKEEDRRDRVDGLDEVFTQEESAGDELGAGAYPSPRVWPVLITDGHCDRSLRALLPFTFEGLTP